MPELLTMQDLANGHLDIKALGEAANGDENTQVITRLGETYPSAKKAIKTLFENGGLPATPFATKALMTASALVDGQYAMVIDETANNGLYVKTTGAWVKSSYDPIDNLVPKIQIAALASSDGELFYVDTKTNSTTGFYDTAGSIVSEPTAYTSDYIPVTKGDCFLVYTTDVNPSYNKHSLVSLFNEDKNYVASINSNDNNLVGSDIINGPAWKREGYGLGWMNSEESLYISPVIVPEDGFIRFSIRPGISHTPLKRYLKETSVFKTNFETLIKEAAFSAEAETLLNFKGSIYSAQIDPNIANNGSLGYASETALTVGAMPAYSGNYHVRSIRYPVKKGQFIHAHYHLWKYGAAVPTARPVYLVFEDEAGNYLGTASKADEFTLGSHYTGSQAVLNLESPYDGYVRVSSFVDFHVPFLIGITDTRVLYKPRYINSRESIKFYTSLGPARDITLAEPNSSTNSFYNLSEAAANPNLSFTRSIPYVLKKGEVLEYTVQATTIPWVATVFKYDEQKNNVGSPLNPTAFPAFELLATEVVEESVKDEWFINNFNSAAIYYGKAKEGKVAYCNEDYDTIIIFNKPYSGSTRFSEFSESDQVEVNIYTKNEYISKRDEGLNERNQIVTSLIPWFANPNDTFGTQDIPSPGQGSFPPILMFKGEVLNFVSSLFQGTKARSLRVRRGEAVNSEIILNTANNTKDRYLTAVKGDTIIPTVSINDNSTYIIDQVYAAETSIVHVGTANRHIVDYMKDVDPDKILRGSKIPMSIMKLSESSVGNTLLASMLYQTQNEVFSIADVDTHVAFLGFKERSGVNTAATFMRKGDKILLEYGCFYSDSGPFYVPIKELIDASRIFKSTNSGRTDKAYFVTGTDDKGKIPKTHIIEISKAKTYFEAPEDCLLFVGTQRIPTPETPSIASIIATGNYSLVRGNPEIVDALSKTKLTLNISAASDTDTKDYAVTSKTFINLDITHDTVFNLCEGSSNSLVIEYWSKLQIIQGGKVAVTLNVLTANQGQSTASLPRKNVNLEFYNDKYEEVYVKFGDMPAEQEMVLKSYQTSDINHFKDSTAAETWINIRRARPYPDNSIFPIELVEDLSNPTNQNALGTTRGFPVEFHRGGEFWSLATIRNKKKRENYCMKKSNNSHILLQADWTLKGVINWNTVNLGNFEVRNPKISKYTVGDTTLPVGYSDVETNTNRMLKWMQDCYTNKVRLKDTYQDYIDLNSFIDYSLALVLTYHWDGVHNNFLLGTYDAQKWHVFWYDADQVWGSGKSNVQYSPYSMTNSNFFNLLLDTFPELAAKRYAELRKLGVIDAKNIQQLFKGYDDKINPYAKKLDMEYWGNWFEAAGVPYSSRWVRERIYFLDSIYGYSDIKDDYLVYAGNYNLPTIAPQTETTITLSNARAKEGEEYRVEYSKDLHGSTVDAICNSDGVITVRYNNSQLAAANPDAGFLKIFRD